MLNFRNAKIDDIKLYYSWANDESVRKQSFNSKKIDFNEHKKWFESKIQDENCLMLIFIDSECIEVGQVRIQKEDKMVAIIGISIAKNQRGKGLAKEMLIKACDFFLKSNSEYSINAYIKETNLSSKYAFENAGFIFVDKIPYLNQFSFHYKKELCR